VGGQQIIQSSGRPLRVARTNRVEVSGSALFVGFPVFVVEESCAGLFCGSRIVSLTEDGIVSGGYSMSFWRELCREVLY
jgi:hypothetical protein